MAQRRILTVLLFSSLLLTGCRKNPQICPIKPPMVLVSPEPIAMDPIRWMAITDRNADEFFKKLSEKSSATGVFALTTEDWANFNVNLARIKVYIESQNAMIAAYRSYYNIPKSVNELSEKSDKNTEKPTSKSNKSRSFLRRINPF